MEAERIEALAATFNSKTLYLLIPAHLSDGPSKICNILLEYILSLNFSSFMYS